ncbi:MAG: oxidative damage protection protein [Oceanospirillaceae bacterium]|nr:oxidative damage protection protein [Oceanospirillaceae bacterium]
MMRTVNCIKYKTELEGLDRPPYPGPKGQEIFDTVSKKAWGEWLSHQTMLINEKHLNMIDPASRALLNEEMTQFMSSTQHAKVEGYVPESKKSD